MTILLPKRAAAVVDHDQVRRAHGYHPLRVKRIVQETADTRSFVLDVPEELGETFRYRPGQFCTFRVHIDGDEYLRSYSMSSAPETDGDLTVTVKRVAGRRGLELAPRPRVGGRCPRDHEAGRRLLRAGRRAAGGGVLWRQRRHAGHVDHQEPARQHAAARQAALRQPRPRLGDLPRRAARAGRPPSGPARRASSPRRRRRVSRPRRDRRIHRRHGRRRRLHLRSRALHGSGRGDPARGGGRRRPHLHRALRERRPSHAPGRRRSGRRRAGRHRRARCPRR